MAKEQERGDIRTMTEQQIFRELIGLHAQAAGTAVSSLLKAAIEIMNPEIQEMTVKEVEYSILEPAIFVKNCLTSHVAGNVVAVFRQRDMQAFLNELMGIDDLPDPDYEFDDVAMSAAAELMNQMVHESVEAMAGYLDDTMESSDCQLTLSDGRQDLSSVISEEPDAKVTVVHYQMKIKDIVESEYIECFSPTAMDSLKQEIQSKREAAVREAEEREATAKAAALKEEQVERESMVRPENTERTSMTAPGPDKTAPETIFRNHPAFGQNLGLIMDVPLNVSVEIGRTRRRMKDVLNFSNGTVVELDKQADAPVDIIVNGQLIARGEVVVIDDNFGVRISEIVNTKNIIGNGEQG